MLAQRVMQEAGQERPLTAGCVYDLPDVVGAALIATGVACLEPHDVREVAAVGGAPERAAVSVGARRRQR